MSLHKLFSKGRKYLLATGFATIIILMIATSLYAIFQIKDSSNKVVEMVNQQHLNSQLLNTMTQSALSRSVLLIEMIQTEDAFDIDDKIIDFNALGTTFSIARENFQNQELDGHLQELLITQGGLQRLNGPLLNVVIDLVQQDKKELASQLFSNQAHPQQKQVIAIIKDMLEYQSQHTKNVLTQAQKDNNRSLFSILALVLFSILISIFLTRYIIKKQKENNEILAYQANTDMLTKLPNRTNLISTIESYIRQAPTTSFAIIFFDIDYFKAINDNYGRETGDKILKKFSHTINSAIGEEDILSRFGGDEFVLLLRSIKSPREIKTFIKSLSCQLDTSYIIDNQEIFISSSVGVSFYYEDSTDARTLLKYADIAMHSAKESGRNNYAFFSKKTIDMMEKEHAMSHCLHTILKNNNKTEELYLMYQPLLNINSDDITECEALIRWTNLEGKVIPPDEFIPLAEKSNLIEKINTYVINETCKQQYEWQKQGLNNMRININLSGNKLIFKKLLQQFKNNIDNLGLSPSLFGIELTERTLFEVSKETIQELDDLRQQGVKISIDDFGTGYSSLSYLKKLPITTLKIDKGFIAGLPEDKDDHALVKAIITLGHSLNLDIVAEGVEKAEQLQFLKEHSCNIAQGYYFHKPLKSSNIPHLKLVA